MLDSSLVPTEGAVHLCLTLRLRWKTVCVLFPSCERQKIPAMWGAVPAAIFTSTHLFREHFEGVQLWLTRWNSRCECRILGGRHKHKAQVWSLSLSSPHLSGQERVLGAGVGTRLLWLHPATAFLPGWFLTNVCGMHNQHLGGAAGGKRKLTRNINSQILECPSVAALLALGRSLQTAGKPWPSCVVCKGGTLGDIAQVSKAKNE